MMTKKTKVLAVVAGLGLLLGFGCSSGPTADEMVDSLDPADVAAYCYAYSASGSDYNHEAPAFLIDYDRLYLVDGAPSGLAVFDELLTRC